MRDRESFAGIDIGGTGMRLAVLTRGKTSRSRIDLPLPKQSGFIAADTLSRRIAEALSVYDATHWQRICIGMAGFPDIVSDTQQLVAKLFAATGAREIVITNDVITAHYGASGGLASITVAAGTGVIALGTDYRDIWNRVDGHGYLLGDEGGGAWIGQRGLICAMRSLDGREGGSPQLATRLLSRYGTTEEAVRTAYTTATPSYELGKFSRDVAEVALNGDPIAIQIWKDASYCIARTAAAAVFEGCEMLSFTGGLFAAGSLLRVPFLEEVQRLLPHIEVLEPLGDAVSGALQIALKGDALQAKRNLIERFSNDDANPTIRATTKIWNGL